MNIQKLVINNYRGFENEHSLAFDNHLNVFVGTNGSGKSSLLDLIATFLDGFAINLAGFSSEEQNYQLDILDIHLNHQSTQNRLYVELPLDFDYTTISWELKKDFQQDQNDFEEIYHYIQQFHKLLDLRNQQTTIPIFKYFSSNRKQLEKRHPINRKRYLSPQFQAYEEAFVPNLNFRPFIDWFITEENKENRNKVKLKDLSYTNPNLNTVRQAIATFLGHFPAANYTNLRVEEMSSPLAANQKTNLLIDKDNQTFALEQLSDGERLLILIIADIAHRLALANPKTPNQSLEGTGIVLIDEIDLHLHPAWQRAVIPCLQKTFPNIQFFITTHSPQVLSNIKAKHIFILDQFQIVPFTPNTYGKDSNSILWDIFGVQERPKHAQKQLDDFYTLLEEEKQPEQAKQILDSLSEQLGNNDPEIIRAKLHFEFQNDID